jgi:RNA polymerase sigma-70 factor (ECF subfamily)
MRDTDDNPAFSVQADVRAPWRRFLDALAPLRPTLHRYCCKLTGNVWDGEDLMQDALLRVFGLLGKIDADLEHPKAYFIRTATHLWIDDQRRVARHRAWAAQQADADGSERAAEHAAELHEAASALLRRLPPRERAAIVMREVLDLSAKDSAALLQMTEGAVKAALHRGRARLSGEDAGYTVDPPPPALVEQFLAALSKNDMTAMQAICSSDLAVELVGGARMDTFEQSKTFFGHAHWVFPPQMAELARAMGFGTDPHWRAADYRGERIVLGYRTLDGVVGLNEVHRIEAEDGKIARIRCYCFCPDTLARVGEDLGIPALRRPYRSPDPRR